MIKVWQMRLGNKGLPRQAGVKRLAVFRQLRLRLQGQLSGFMARRGQEMSLEIWVVSRLKKPLQDRAMGFSYPNLAKGEPPRVLSRKVLWEFGGVTRLMEIRLEPAVMFGERGMPQLRQWEWKKEPERIDRACWIWKGRTVGWACLPVKL